MAGHITCGRLSHILTTTRSYSVYLGVWSSHPASYRCLLQSSQESTQLQMSSPILSGIHPVTEVFPNPLRNPPSYRGLLLSSQESTQLQRSSPILPGTHPVTDVFSNPTWNPPSYRGLLLSYLEPTQLLRSSPIMSVIHPVLYLPLRFYSNEVPVLSQCVGIFGSMDTTTKQLL